MTQPWQTAISLPRLRTIRGQDFLFMYHGDNIMTHWAALHSYKYQPLPHALKPKTEYLYQNRDPNTLWWRVTTNHLSMKKVVRTGSAKKIRKVFREVLKQQGYDAYGRPLAQEHLPEGARLRSKPLRGTLEIRVEPSAITQRESNMKSQMMGLLSRTNRAISDMASAWEKHVPAK
ncbi:hypothetical protein BGW36DRAFT_381968 [Talaromyces proteolyticus]|uniref:Uncharacterized protein n=1 Tax=Talaromyces proteolyticus TaxID=1131652 RepID=A0AAD4KMH8_9EURO|nr:uncharacterized protein BGW36DRAFT_381968 [Talaromyces proteolyticus]KAH8695032.1 hypothetical protein BGW36DRAFT_381968 [Talaromyces proteolyticus]